MYRFTVKHSADSPYSIGCGVAVSANSCIDFQSALDLSFFLYMTRAKLQLHN